MPVDADEQRFGGAILDGQRGEQRAHGPHRAGDGVGAVGHGHLVVPLELAPVDVHQQPVVGLSDVGPVERGQLGDAGGAGVAEQQRGVPLSGERGAVEGGEHLAQRVRGGGRGLAGRALEVRRPRWAVTSERPSSGRAAPPG
ncbi:hypothetical protein [Streptomyces hirsutus]|uniref:hypothetical protein n=1 Tax=Streptomyces hirsutus TaxID=35620 RepID=UPI00332BBA6C